MTSEIPEAGRRVTVMGVMTLIFGAFNIFRLFPEFLALHHAGNAYSKLIWFEFALGLIAVISGIALLILRSRWGCYGAILFWGALAASAAIIIILPNRDLPSHQNSEVLFIPRALYYAVILVSLPYSLWALITRATYFETSRSAVVGWLLLGLLAGVNVGGVLFKS